MDKIINKIVKIIKEAKAPVDPKLISWIEKRYGPWNDKDFISDDGDTYFKYEKTSPGGGLSHTIIRLPSFGELIKQLKDSRDAANDLIRGESVRDDDVLRAIYDQQKDTYNTFRTHLRKEYPAFYSQLKGQLTEDEIDEMSVSGAAGGFLTPYAFRKPKKKQEPIPESHTDAENKKLKIISKELKKASKMHKGQAKRIDKIVKEDLNLDSYGYKLVPKDKDGNYVQKGSKLDVVNLFEDQKEYQAKRIAAFSTIEQEMNDIYKMLSNAKNETSEYYNDNPSSYTVVKPTDLVLDYIKDIKDLLKGE
jgi:hypothetical protein|tara:strand:- start:3743 stop:4660 length:918 start_codon:yes stop_codon:yes gene_type:complete